MIALFAEVWFGVALFGLVVGLLLCFLLFGCKALVLM